MDNKIIQQGTIAKWRFSINRADFDMAEDDFSVTLSCGIYPHKEVVIDKSDMEVDGDAYMFTFDSLSVLGQINATCTFNVSSNDGSTRKIVDRQVIGLVVNHACPKFQACRTCESSDVTYEPVAAEGHTILYGSGLQYTDATQTKVAQKVDGDYDVEVKADEDKIFFVIPANMVINEATMSNFTFPLLDPVAVTVGGNSYIYYESANTYDAGTYTIKLK